MNSCIYIELASHNVYTCISRENKHLRGRAVESRGYNLILKSRFFYAQCAMCSIFHVAVHAWLWSFPCIIIHQRSKIIYPFSLLFYFPPIFSSHYYLVFFFFSFHPVYPKKGLLFFFSIHQTRDGTWLCKVRVTPPPCHSFFLPTITGCLVHHFHHSLSLSCLPHILFKQF